MSKINTRTIVLQDNKVVIEFVDLTTQSSTSYRTTEQGIYFTKEINEGPRDIKSSEITTGKKLVFVPWYSIRSIYFDVAEDDSKPAAPTIPADNTQAQG